MKGVNGRSSGSVSWGALFSFATGLVEQGGSRRGALMLILDDWHPDILEFINAKRDMGAITNANISVAVSDTFMQAVENDDEWELVFPDTSDPEYDQLWDGNLRRWRDKYGQTRKGVQAGSGPGNLGHAYGVGVAFRRAGRRLPGADERRFQRLVFRRSHQHQPMRRAALARLGRVQPGSYQPGAVYQGSQSARPKSIGRACGAAVRTGVRFLDNIIDITPYFFEENEAVQKNERRIGMGTLGSARC